MVTISRPKRHCVVSAVTAALLDVKAAVLLINISFFIFILNMQPEIYRDYPSPLLFSVNIHRETLTQYITFKRGGRGESALLYSVVLQPCCPASTPLCG
jgi:hypothetical protein